MKIYKNFNIKIIMALRFLFFLMFIQLGFCLMPPKFQWKSIDFAWDNQQARDNAIKSGNYIPENVMPTGIARWKEKLFITIPRWRKGVPSSLNYINVNGRQEQPLIPYPKISGFSTPSNDTVVCAFRSYVDTCDRLWVVDNGVSDITGDLQQISEPAIFIYDLTNDALIHKYVLDDSVIRESSVFTSVVVDAEKSKSNDKNKCKRCIKTYAYITDMGSNAIIVYSLQDNVAWRVENPYFHFDPHAGIYKVGGIDFYWSDGISSAALSKINKDGFRDLYFHPTSSTKQFRMSTKLLRNKTMAADDIFNGVQVIGDRGPKSQATACDYDPQHNVLFYTQLSKNGIGCWNLDKPFEEGNTIILSDCVVMEFPNDVKVDLEGNIWMLSNRQSRFLYGIMDYEQINYRILTAPTSEFIKGTNCEKLTGLCNKLFRKRSKSSISNKSGLSPSASEKNINSNEYVCPTEKGKKCPTTKSKSCLTSQDTPKEPKKDQSCQRKQENDKKVGSKTRICQDVKVISNDRMGQSGQTSSVRTSSMQGKGATISRTKTQEYECNMYCPVNRGQRIQGVQVTIDNNTKEKHGQTSEEICPATIGKQNSFPYMQEHFDDTCPAMQTQTCQDEQGTINDNSKKQFGQTPSEQPCPALQETSSIVSKESYCTNKKENQQSNQTSFERICPAMLGKSANINRKNISKK